jgi:N-acetylglucosaminyldiphosphoundecaprenol N-acetyl-beta-D-mannosaminyltransferase
VVEMEENLLGVKISSQTYAQLTDIIFKKIAENKKAFIVAVNPEKIMKAQNDKNLMEVLNRAHFRIPDGIGILIASRIKGGNIRKRVTGIDLMLHLCEAAAKNKRRVFLFGGKPGVAEKASESLKETFSSIQICGVLDGYTKDNQFIRDKINKANPDIIFVALGSPNQEYWIVDNMNEMSAKVFQGVGGSFDVISGRVKRAPIVYRKLGLEWLYRLVKEPVRWKRQIVLPKFLFKALKE